MRTASRTETMVLTVGGMFARNAFSSVNLIAVTFVKKDSNTTVSVREAVRILSMGNGQEFFKCLCTGKCQTNRCSCKKPGVLCNSKCHGSETCNNKEENLDEIN